MKIDKLKDFQVEENLQDFQVDKDFKNYKMMVDLKQVLIKDKKYYQDNIIKNMMIHQQLIDQDQKKVKK